MPHVVMLGCSRDPHRTRAIPPGVGGRKRKDAAVSLLLAYKKAQDASVGYARAMDESLPADLPPAGWYPVATGTSRYWDGSGWTDVPAPPLPVGAGSPPIRGVPSPTTPAGWYAAGDRPGEQRYWNGSTWTDAYQPIVPGKKPRSAGFWIYQTLGSLILIPIALIVIVWVIITVVASVH